MEKILVKAVLFSDGDSDIHAIIRGACEQNNCDLIYSCTLAELIVRQTHARAECVIIDKSMNRYFSEILSLLKFANLPKPTLIFICDNCDDPWEKISAFAYKVPIGRISSFLKTHILNNPYYRLVSKTQGLLNNYLKELGFETKYTGYNYLKMALTMAMEDKSIIKSLQSQVYPVIASRYHTNIQNVTRNIRSLINQACKKKNFQELFCKKSNRSVITYILNNFEELLSDYSNMGILS